MAKRTHLGLVALSSSAITAVYLAGFVATEGVDASLRAAAAATPTAVVAPAPTNSSRGSSRLAIPPPPLAGPDRRSPTNGPTSGTYHDGTYQGSGTSRRGGFRVAVTIAGGHIADVSITQVTTQYPVSRIAKLPAQVVARQSAQVDRVTGATFSVQAFQQAVQQALSQASA